MNGLQWPTSTAYLEQVLPAARRTLTTKDLQRGMILRQFRNFWTFFDTRADDLSALMQSEWGLTAELCDLPHTPRWIINATCYETGKNWRFERFRMGDYLFGYSYDTHLPLADAVASSAGFPGLVGPLVLDTRKYAWFQYLDHSEPEIKAVPEGEHQHKTQAVQPSFSPVHLWDGGVYDNNGLEGLLDVQHGWRDRVDFLIVSDGSGRSKPEHYQRGVKALMRLATGIMMDQVRSLRARTVLERLINHADQDKGSFLQIGNTCRHVLAAAGRGSEIPTLAPGCLSDDEAYLAETMPTVIRKLVPYEFERLFRHGYEVANYTLYAYHPEEFPYIEYQPSAFSSPA
jgi:NTE family protein